MASVWRCSAHFPGSWEDTLPDCYQVEEGRRYKKRLRRGKYFIQSQTFYSVYMQSDLSLSKGQAPDWLPGNFSQSSVALSQLRPYSSSLNFLCLVSCLKQKQGGRFESVVILRITRYNYFWWWCFYQREHDQPCRHPRQGLPQIIDDSSGLLNSSKLTE